MNTEVYTEEYLLTAGESNARGEMPSTLIASRLIEISTRHADAMGIGYEVLAQKGVAWVLSRLGWEMYHTPRINERYSISTWVESWNRHFSNRCFRIDAEDGTAIGYGRSVWAAINIADRNLADLTEVVPADTPTADLPCPMPAMRNHKAILAPERTEAYTFRFMDLDFNRHVNSVRYIEHILNLWPVGFHDAHKVARFEIAYRHECHADETVLMRVADKLPQAAVDVLRHGTEVVSCNITWT